MREKTYRIGEAADMLRLKSYVLRFWETEFPQLVPLRTDKGQRLYTDYHIALLHRIRQLLHEQGMTLEGARRVLASSARGEVSLDIAPPYGQLAQPHTPLGHTPLGTPDPVAFTAPTASVGNFASASLISSPIQATPYGGQYGVQPVPQASMPVGVAPQQAQHEPQHEPQHTNGHSINRNVVHEMREELLALRNMLTAED